MNHERRPATGVAGRLARWVVERPRKRECVLCSEEGTEEDFEALELLAPRQTTKQGKSSLSLKCAAPLIGRPC